MRNDHTRCPVFALCCLDNRRSRDPSGGIGKLSNAAQAAPIQQQPRTRAGRSTPCLLRTGFAFGATQMPNHRLQCAWIESNSYGLLSLVPRLHSTATVKEQALPPR